MRNHSSTLTWLHLSDLHFILPSNPMVGQRLDLLDALRDDITQQIISKSLVPDFVFITGDISFSGTREEYSEAGNWIKQLLAATRLTEQKVFMVPGNHDVLQARVKNQPVPRIVHHALRDSMARTVNSDYLDSIVEHSTDSGYVIWPKFEEYAKFASCFAAPLCDGQLFWNERVPTPLGWVHLAGLNTAVLSFDDDDSAKNLRLGSRQLRAAVSSSADDLLIVLLHHPLEWIGDGNLLRERLITYPHLVLSGHVHDSSINISSSRNASSLLELRAGACQSSDGTHSWSMGRLSAAGLELWPRTWMPKRVAFSCDRNFDDLDAERLKKSPDELPGPLKLWLQTSQTRGLPTLKPRRKTSKPLRSPTLERTGSVKSSDALALCVAFAGHADALLTAGENNQISWFDLSQPKYPQIATLNGHGGTVTSLAVSPDGRRAVSGGRDKRLIVWDLVTKSQIRDLPVGTWTYALASTEDGTKFVAGHNDRLVSIWNFESDQPIAKLTGHSDNINEIQISKDDRFGLSASKDGTLKLWDLGIGEPLRSFKGHEQPVYCVALSHDSQRMISGDTQGRVIVWETFTGRILNRLHIHSGRINSVIMLGDDSFCLSVGCDTQLCLFKVDDTSVLQRLTLPHELNSLAVSPCGRRIAVACDDGNVYLFEVVSC